MELTFFNLSKTQNLLRISNLLAALDAAAFGLNDFSSVNRFPGVAHVERANGNASILGASLSQYDQSFRRLSIKAIQSNLYEF